MARVGLIMLAVVLAMAGAGCRSDPGAHERVTQAQATTLAAGSASFSVIQAFTGSRTGEQRIEGRGTLDFRAGRGQLTVTAPTAGASAGAAEFQAIFEGSTFYLRLPLVELPTPWVRLTPEDEGLASLDRLREISGDPSRNLAMLHGAGTDIEVVGEEQVGSALATRYHLTVDLQLALAAAPAEDRPFLAQQVQTFGVTQVPTDVWLDDEGRLRRQTYRVDLSHSTATGDQEASAPLPEAIVTTVEYDDFGAPVKITVPSPDQVTDATDLLDVAASTP